MTKVLIDADPGTDDAVAVAALLAAQNVDVVGVTTVAGNSTVENTTANALGVLELLDRTDVPVARGCDRPLAHRLSTTEWIHGPGGLRGDVPAPTDSPVDTHAVEFLREQTREHGTSLTIACFGPLTNLAAALAVDSDLASRVGGVVAMGGAVRAGGNATPAAEYNVYADPVAASRVVQDASPTLVPLDVTESATLTETTLGEFRQADAPLPTVAQWCDYPEELRGPEGVAVHDAAVSAQIIDGVLTVEPRSLSVVDGHGPCRGATIADTRPESDAPTRAGVATDIDVEAFRETVVGALRSLA